MRSRPFGLPRLSVLAAVLWWTLSASPATAQLPSDTLGVAALSCAEVRAQADTTTTARLVALADRLRGCLSPSDPNYPETFLLDLRGAGPARAIDRVRAVLDTMDAMTPPPSDAFRSRMYDEAASAFFDLGRSEDGYHHLRLAHQYAADRSDTDRLGLLTDLAVVSRSMGAYEPAQGYERRALTLAQRLGRTQDEAEIRLLTSRRILRQTTDVGTPEGPEGRRHLRRAERLLPSLPDSLRAPFRARIAAHRTMYSLFEDAPENVLSRADAFLASEDAAASNRARALGHEAAARAAFKLERYDITYRHLDDAEDALTAQERSLRRDPSLAPLLYFRVATATQTEDPRIAHASLRALRTLGEPGADHHLSRASVYVFEYFPEPLSPVLIVILSVALVLIVGLAFYALLPYGVLPDPSLEEEDDASLDLSKPFKAPPSQDQVREVLSRLERVKADATPDEAAEDDPDAPPPDRARLNLFDADGTLQGSMPLPRLLRSVTQPRFVGYESEERIYIIEQVSTASTKGVERLDGGGFTLHELPDKISGIVVASLARPQKQPR